MDFDTAVLLAMTACACGWYISFGIVEQKREVKAREREELERRKRVERLKKIFGRFS